MIKTATTLLIGCFLVILTGTNTDIEEGLMNSDLTKDIEMVTDYGTIIMRLSDETPEHRNNFIKLVNDKFYDSILFHRLKEGFFIQTGNHKTKAAYPQMKQDSISLPNLIESEIRPNLFHKRGALNAARKPDIYNPSRASSGSEFTIIQGTIQTDSTLDVNLKRINKVLAKNAVMNRPDYKKDLANFDSLVDIELQTMKPYSYPEAHRYIYKTIGGIPHLDQNYTVFGEVVKGMEVVDSIAAVATNKKDKPLNDVYILTARMITRKTYN